MRPSAPPRSRRRFLRGSLVLAGLGLLAGCNSRLLSREQPAKVPRIGYLGGGAAGSAPLEALQEGLRDVGYVEGQSIMIEYRFTDGRLEQAPTLAAELVGLNVDLIVANGGDATAAAMNATATIPIVGMPLGNDPVATGFVASLARPGGNVTGLSTVASETVGKRLQLLKEVAPSIGRAAILWNANNAIKAAEFKEAQGVAPSLGLQVVSAEVRRPDDFEGAFQAVAASRADSLVVLQDPLTVAHRTRIVAVAVQQRLPAMYEIREFTDVGGLMNYGINRADLWRRAAAYVDKILKGAKPADLPVERPTKFEFVINLKTAKELGLTIPQSLLQQATEVIQ